MFQVLQAVITGQLFRSVELFGQLDEIARVIFQRIHGSCQGPRIPPESDYWIYVDYQFTTGGKIRIEKISAKFDARSKKKFTFFELYEREGEVHLGKGRGLKNFYLQPDGIAIRTLKDFLLQVEDRHSLRTLVKKGPKAIPRQKRFKDEEILQEIVIAPDEDLAEENLANQTND